MILEVCSCSWSKRNTVKEQFLKDSSRLFNRPFYLSNSGSVEATVSIFPFLCYKLLVLHLMLTTVSDLLMWSDHIQLVRTKNKCNYKLAGAPQTNFLSFLNFKVFRHSLTESAHACYSVILCAESLKWTKMYLSNMQILDWIKQLCPVFHYNTRHYIITILYHIRLV